MLLLLLLLGPLLGCCCLLPEPRQDVVHCSRRRQAPRVLHGAGAHPQVRQLHCAPLVGYAPPKVVNGKVKGVPQPELRPVIEGVMALGHCEPRTA